MKKSLLYFLFPGKRADEAMQKIAGEEHSQSYWSMVGKQFRKNKIAVYSLRFVYTLVFFALLADFFANEKPLVCSYHKTTYFPIFRSYAISLGIVEWPTELQNVEWKKLEYDWALFPP